jgi:hypothetical protein
MPFRHLSVTMALAAALAAACGDAADSPATGASAGRSGAPTGAGAGHGGSPGTGGGAGRPSGGGSGTDTVSHVGGTGDSSGNSGQPGAAGAGSSGEPPMDRVPDGTAGAPSGEGGASPVGGGESGGAPDTSEGGAAGAVPDSAGFLVEVSRASDHAASAPGTVGIVTWSLPGGVPIDAHIEFGLDSSYGMVAPVNLAEPDHRTLLLGMKPSRTYHFRISATDGTSTWQSSDYTLRTGPVPAGLVPYRGFRVDEPKRERGFLVLSYWSGAGSAVAFIIDADGDIVWWHSAAYPGIGHAVMSATGTNLWLVNTDNAGAPLERVTMDGLDATVYADTRASHDITPVTGETMAYIDYGEADCHSIFEIDPSGDRREVFESDGYVDPTTCHGNAVRYSSRHDLYTFSDRFNDIIGVTRLGEIRFRVSSLVNGGHDAWGGAQHGHQLLEDSILLFANTGAGSRASAVFEYSLAGGELMHFTNGHFSLHMGDVQRLPGGDLLVTYSNSSVIQETDPSGRVVLEIDGGGSRFGYASFRPTLYGRPPNL